MVLVRIMHMVDTPLAGKCDFNYLCSWFDIVHSDLDFLPLHNVHPMSLIGPYYGSGLLFQELWLLSLCSRCFLRTNVQCSWLMRL